MYRARLDRHQSLQVNTHFAELFEIYKIVTRSHSSRLQILAPLPPSKGPTELPAQVDASTRHAFPCIATGNWGCGVFGGFVELKALCRSRGLASLGPRRVLLARLHESVGGAGTGAALPPSGARLSPGP